MDIATKASRIRTGEDSQHGSRSAPEKAKVPAHVLLGSLLRRQPQSERASEDAYFPEAPAGSISPTPTGAQTGDAAPGQASSNAYEALSYGELQQQIRDRNEGRSDDDRITVSGRTEVLIERLVQDDAQQLASV